MRHRRQSAGAANLHLNGQKPGHGLFGRKLPRRRPARRAACETETFLKRQIVDLVDHAVDIIGQLGPFQRDPVEKRLSFRDACQLCGKRIDRETPCAKLVKIGGMGCSDRSGRKPHGVGKQGKRTTGRHLGIKLAQGTRCGIARVGEQLVSRSFLRGIDGEKFFLPQKNFATDFDQIRRFTPQTERDAFQCLQIGGDVFAFRAVAACGAACKPPVFISQADGDTVDFGFADKGEGGGLRLIKTQKPDDAFYEVLEVGAVEHVVQ